MTYTFDTSNRNGKYEIKITVSLNSSQSYTKTITSFDYHENKYGTRNDIENVIKEILDNIRFTVKEREEAEQDAKKFVEYVKLNEQEVEDFIPIVEGDLVNS